MHGIEDIFMHYVNLECLRFSEFIHFSLEFSEIDAHFRNISKHYHTEHVVKNGLRNVVDIYRMLSAF